MNWIIQIQRAYGVIMLALIACVPTQQPTEAPIKSKAQQLVAASIAAHGGQERWEALTDISFIKTVTLYDSSGGVESHARQYHQYTLQPRLSGTISWQSGEDSIHIVFEDDQAYRMVNDKVDTSIDPESSRNAFMAAYHVLFQPFLLSGNDVSLSYTGEDRLTDGTAVDVIKPTYENSNGDDWRYYISQENQQLLSYLVFHVDHFSYVINLSFDETSPLILTRERKSYRADGDRNIQYLRAEYFYEDYQMTFRDSNDPGD